MATGRGTSAKGELLRHYEERNAAADEWPRLGKPVVGVTSNTVPRELIVAADMVPMLLSPRINVGRVGVEQLPHHIYMEDVFDALARGIFDFLMSGAGRSLRSVILPRTSEMEHKLFLYLKEVQRQEAALPTDIYLYNLLHTTSATSRDYSRDSTAALKNHLATLSGQEVTQDRLREAIRHENEARKAARTLVALRESGRLGGAEGFAMLGARHFMDAREYAGLVEQAASEIAEHPALNGPRLMIKGYPLDHTGLHVELESLGAVVVAEDDWHGSRGATEDIPAQGDPLEAIIEHYYRREASPRLFPPAIADGWFYEKARGVEGVVFYLPPDDDVLGWDFPRHCRALDEWGVPHVLVRLDAALFGSASGESSAAVEQARASLSTLVTRLRSKS